MSRYNPDIHHRRSIRLKGYDYAKNGAYFLTLCTAERTCYFEQFQQLVKIVKEHWQNIPDRFPHVVLDDYVIMPNHFHGIIVLCRDTPCGYPLPPAQLQAGHPQGVPLQETKIGDIIGSFKSLCVNAWLKTIKTEKINATGRFWQSSYYEHVIRNDGEMERIREYIANNPLLWELDRENPAYNRPQELQSQIEQWLM
jgi:REP element-mobilizing transposase RayT